MPPLPDELGEAKTFGTPAWWFSRELKRLSDRAVAYQLHQDYYHGRHRLSFATEQFRKAFSLLFRAFADNFCQIVVDAPMQRLTVQGFLIPSGDEAPTKGDDEAWRIWQANNLDSEHRIGHTEAGINGRAYALVGPGETYPEITIESCGETIIDHQAGYRRRRLAALKVWRDDSGLAFATLYLPTEIWKLASDKAVEDAAWSSSSWLDGTKWVQRPGEDAFPMVNELGVVPIVSLANRPGLLHDGESEIAQVIPLQDAVNKTVMDMIVASEFTGFAQRWATGIEVPTDAETGQPIEVWKLAIDRFLSTPNDQASFGTLQQTDLGGYVKAIEMLVQHIATQSSTPPHYLLGSMGSFPSGESLKAAETALVAKVYSKQVVFGEAWEDVIRLAFLAAGDTAKADAARAAQVIWKDAESRTEAEHTDALLKQQALGLPDEFLWGKLGLSPQEIERVKEMRAAQAALTPAPIQLAPPVPQPVPAA